MHRVIVDEATSRLLGQASTITEICDAEGKVIGTFRPRRVPRAMLESEDVPTEELIQAGRLRTGRSFSDVIDDLERRP